DRLVGLELDRLRERSDLARLHVVGDTLHIFQRAVLLPDVARLARHAAVGIDIVFGDGNDESIDIAGHGSLLRLVEKTGKALTVGQAKNVAVRVMAPGD